MLLVLAAGNGAMVHGIISFTFGCRQRDGRWRRVGKAGNVGGFSGYGPSSDGQSETLRCRRGRSAVIANPFHRATTFGSGTSLLPAPGICWDSQPASGKPESTTWASHRRDAAGCNRANNGYPGRLRHTRYEEGICDADQTTVHPTGAAGKQLQCKLAMDGENRLAIGLVVERKLPSDPAYVTASNDGFHRRIPIAKLLHSPMTCAAIPPVASSTA